MKKALIYTIPALLCLAIIILFPLIYNIYLSFINQAGDFSFSNYRNLLEDPEFRNGVLYSLEYGLATVIIQSIIGVLIALWLNRVRVMSNTLRTLLTLPYIIPVVICVLIWRWIFNDTYGIVNYLLKSTGISSKPILWFNSELIMISLIMVSVWKYTPFVVLFVLARLKSIPNSVYEAAELDQTSRLRTFISITLPNLIGVLSVVVLLRFLFMFTKFDIVWLISGGASGSGLYIETLPVYIYEKTFGARQAGMGAAAAVVLLFLLAAFAIIYSYIVRRLKHVLEVSA